MKITGGDIPTYNKNYQLLTSHLGASPSINLHINYRHRSNYGIQPHPTFLYRSAGVQQHHLASFQHATSHAVGDDLRQGRNPRATRDQRQLRRCGRTGEGWQVQG